MGKAFLYGNGGGSASGGTLTVTAPAGVTVTVSKDGKTKTKAADSSGVAVFKGLKSGTWTVSISDGEQTASKAVEITTDYSMAITFFSATINVTYPEGSTCTATDGVTTLTAPDTSGVWVCVVPNAGIWTVTCPVSPSKTVTITENGKTTSVALGLYLYNNGNEFESYTGGWATDGYKTGYPWPYKATKYDDYIAIAFVGGQGVGGIGTVNKISFGDYATLKAIVAPTQKMTLKVLSAQSPVDNNGKIVAKAEVAASADQTTMALSVNAIETGYVAIDGDNGKIHSVWLE